MTDRAVAERSTNQPPAADALRWVVHPARGRPVAAAAALGYIVAVTALVEATSKL